MNATPRSAPRVLLVDDDQDILDFLKVGLARLGFEVTCVRNAAEAEAHVKGSEVDAVVTDLDLGGTTGGLALCERLTRARPGLPVVVLTAHDEAEDAALSLGACAVLIKPVETSRLADSLRSFV